MRLHLPVKRWKIFEINIIHGFQLVWRIQMTNLMVTISVLTGIVAIYGAVLSTMLYLRDKSSVRVSAEPVLANPAGRFEWMLRLKAVNKGRRPVKMSSLPVLLTDDRKAIIFKDIMRNQPPILNEGEEYQELLDAASLNELVIKLGKTKIQAVRFCDTVGRRYIYRFKRSEWERYMKTILK